MIYFEWDEAKAARNLSIHGVSFKDAALIFDDAFRLTEPDFSERSEDRWRTIGMLRGSVILFVVHLEETEMRDTYIRIISARRATAGEQVSYEKNRALLHG